MMEQSPFVTVVMAVYNAELFLDRSIQSIINQTYKDWILFCVDDGSTDGSLRLLNTYASEDHRIKVFAKENGGPASARELAYNNLYTPYAISLDADDEFSPNLLTECVECAKRTGADSIAPNFMVEFSDGSFMDWNKSYNHFVGKELNGKQAFEMTFINPSMHGVNLWRSSLLKEYGVGSNANYNKFNEDDYIQRLLFLNSTKVVFSGGDYIYRCNGQSITKKFSLKQLGYLVTCKKLVDLVHKYDIGVHTYNIIMEYYFRTLIQLQIRLFNSKNNISKSDYKYAKQCLKNEYVNLMPYKKIYKFKDKSNSHIYRLASTSGYPIFLLTCKLFSYTK